eukprot:TRINITY_DN78258_c0_g1_i1.p1 TRINITY_DN78258_c0_g1~~TRINITY_DN78258_c0_g1_i1.p1  ORF type:complete len:579 (+),score=55.19 TRINITY_DN78258_c0_g1_i1:132-1868(+)
MERSACCGLWQWLTGVGLSIRLSSSNIPLQDSSLLRGTTSAIILQGFGRRLRGSVGGLGSLSAEGDAEYSKSFPVDYLDVFLSHSWHADWKWKYVLLLLYFNLKPALTVSIMVGLACTAANWNTTAGVSMIVLSGFFSFGFTLLTWHLFGRKLAGCTRSVFLDKVCIHQSDETRKEQGIKAIGAILERTNVMLVAWDPSYFSRLWCVYELSAFKFARRDGRITIRSMQFVLFLSGALFVTNISYLVLMLRHNHDRIHVLHAVICFVILLPLAPSVMFIRSFHQERLDLKRQLKEFSVRETKCFCCTHHHRHPDNGSPLMCDREHVYDSIAQWYGNGNRRLGLECFDRTIRGQLKEDLHRTLGKSWNIPYHYTLLVGLPSFHLHMAWHCHLGRLESVVGAFELLLCRFPLCVLFALMICSWIENRETRQAPEVELSTERGTATDRSCNVESVSKREILQADEVQLHGTTTERSCNVEDVPKKYQVLASVMVVIASSAAVIVLTEVADAMRHWNNVGSVGLGIPSSLLAGMYLCWLLLQVFAVVMFYFVLAKVHVNETVRMIRSSALEMSDYVGRVTSLR